MRKELTGFILIFLVIITSASLLTYSSDDPSVHHAISGGQIHNFFGLFGAHLSGLFIGLFGLGAFWIPILFLIASFHILKTGSIKVNFVAISGGLVLIITTGALFALFKNNYTLFGNSYSAAGLIGSPVSSFFMNFASSAGGTLILIFFFCIGFILSTGFSVVKILRFIIQNIKAILDKIYFRISSVVNRLKTRRTKIRERKKKHTKIKKIKKVKSESPDKEESVKIKIQPPLPGNAKPIPKQNMFDFMLDESDYTLPSVKFLNEPEEKRNVVDNENLKMQSQMLEAKLKDFGIDGIVREIHPGPVITTFEYKPAPGVKISKIVNLADDLALALRAISIRIVAPIPGKDVVGVEIPNNTREMVCFKEVITSESYNHLKSHLTICLGKDIVGKPVAVEMDKMPHLLIAGATGAGKSVGLNVMIASLLYKSTPEDVKLLMIDPKRIELSVYDGIPHLISPVVTDMKKATNALYWAVREMERRYELLAELKVRNILQYNKKVKNLKNKSRGEDEQSYEKLPYIVIIIDEFADLMMVASKEVEVALTRLAQMSRAAGLHIILATQRPSVDVITGIIKANFPTRIAFQVSSRIDSRTIIDSNGAENLLGNGDMLYLPPGTAKVLRIHGAFISDGELNQVIEFLKGQKPPEYIEEILEKPQETKDAVSKEDYDEKYDEALAFVTKTGYASISKVQRYLRIGYNRAARIIEIMEIEGIVGPADGAKPREVLVKSFDEMDQ